MNIPKAVGIWTSSSDMNLGTNRALQPECLDLDHIKEKSKSAYSLTKISQEDYIAKSHRLKN